MMLSFHFNNCFPFVEILLCVCVFCSFITAWDSFWIAINAPTSFHIGVIIIICFHQKIRNFLVLIVYLLIPSYGELFPRVLLLFLRIRSKASCFWGSCSATEPCPRPRFLRPRWLLILFCTSFSCGNSVLWKYLLFWSWQQPRGWMVLVEFCAYSLPVVLNTGIKGRSIVFGCPQAPEDRKSEGCRLSCWCLCVTWRFCSTYSRWGAGPESPYKAWIR